MRHERVDVHGVQMDRASEDLGERIFALASELFPICRSLTGRGVRETLGVLRNYIDLTIVEVPTGTQVFDWSVPKEWIIRDAYIADETGRRVVDLRSNNLHVVGYSTPVRARLSLQDLKAHIHTLPDQPHVIPYRTSYYTQQWGFCMAHDALTVLADGCYEAVIDSELFDGALTYGEFAISGTTGIEMLLSAHICHPSLANDNCSGVALLTLLAAELVRTPGPLGYRFLFSPGTIGPLAWLSANQHRLEKIHSGMVVSCVGDGGGPNYKKSRRGDAAIDQAMAHVFRHSALSGCIRDFSPYGYDERQFCSPGFNLPVGLFQRSMHGSFPQYHTSADNLDFIRPEHLADSYCTIRDALNLLERDRTMLNTCPYGEPALGRRGLYATMGGHARTSDATMALLWVLNYSDGHNSLLDIAERSGLPFTLVDEAACALQSAGLLRPV